MLYTNKDGLKYDFVVHSGGKASDIKLQYTGATALSLKGGALMATTPMGSITEDAPYSYVMTTKKELASSYMLQGNVVGFNVTSPKSSYVIDPGLKWATYFGGSNADHTEAITADTVGNAIITGFTGSVSNIATTGAHQTTQAGQSDAYVAKFNPSGSLLWATYYGSADHDYSYNIACSIAGDIYFGGPSNGPGLATSGSHQSTLPSIGGNIFFVKLNSSGVRQWATYYNSGYLYGIACDNAGNVYVGGQMNDTAGFYTAGGFMNAASAYNTIAGFLAKFNSNGVRQWGTFYPARVTDIEADPWSDIIISGTLFSGTLSTITPLATAGAYQTSSNGSWEGHIGKLNSSGGRIWATHFGGGGIDYLYDHTVDGYGNIYIGGTTTSSTPIASTGAFQSTIPSTSQPAGYIAKLDSAGVRQWGTYFHQNTTIKGLKAAYDGNLYVTGNTATGLTATTGAYQGSNAGDRDLFLSIFDPGGNRQYATYYGGSGKDDDDNGGYNGPFIASTNKGRVYIIGTTQSTSSVATLGSYQSVYGGTRDGLLVQFDMDTSVFITQPFLQTSLCKGDTMKVNFGVTQSFRTGNSFTLQLSDATGSFGSPTTLGTINGQNGGQFSAIIPLTITNGTGHRIRLVASGPSKTSADNSLDITIKTPPSTPVATTNAPICSGNTLTLGSTTSTTNATYAWTGPSSFTSSVRNTTISNAGTVATGTYIISAELNGCIRKDTIAVLVAQTPQGLTAGSNSPVCSGVPLNLTSSSTTPGVSYSWSGRGFSSSQQNPVLINPQVSNSGMFTVNAVLGICSTSATTVVAVNQSPTAGAYVSPDDTICTFSTATFVGFASNAGTPTYQWYKNGVAIPGATNNVYTSGGFSNGDQMQLEIKGNTGCNQPVRSQPITLTVLNISVTPIVAITPNPGINIRPGTPVTFSATVTNGGPNPKFQWKKNGNNVGLNIASYTDNTLMPGDAITVELISDHPCAQPNTATAPLLYIWWPLSVEDYRNNTTVLLYPNPNKGRFTIQGINATEVQFSIINALGQIVYIGTQQNVNGNVSIDAKLPIGPYLIHMQAEQRYVFRFNVVQ